MNLEETTKDIMYYSDCQWELILRRAKQFSGNELNKRIRIGGSNNPRAVQRPQMDRQAAENLRASWEEIEKLDADLAEKMKAMTRRYGYHLDPAMHPQSLDTSAFRAGGVETRAGRASPGELYPCPLLS